MSAAEYACWALTPEFLGDEREDYRSARAIATYINWAGKCLKEGAAQVNPLDLMPYRERRRKRKPRDWRKRVATAIQSHFAALREAQACELQTQSGN